MNQENLNFLITIVGMAGLLIPTIPVMFRPLGSERRVTPIGWSMFVIGFVMIGLGIGNIHLTRKAEKKIKYIADSTKRADDSLRQIARKEYEDSLKSYHNYTIELLARYGLKVDTLTNTVKKFDTSVQKEIPPTLTILRGLYFDSSGTTKEKRIAYALNALNADVHILAIIMQF